MKTKSILTLLFLGIWMSAYSAYLKVDSVHVVNATSCKVCNGTATAYVSGGYTPYTYYWSNGATTSTITGLCPGTYYITVQDSHGDSNFAVCTVGPNINATMSGTNASCSLNNGSASVTASGGTSPYTYLWSNGATTASISSLSAGTYSVTVTDVNGCSTSNSVTIYSSSPMIDTSVYVTPATCSNNNGSVTIYVYGGATPYTYAWTPTGGTTNNATGLSAGTYTITVTDANGCSVTASEVVPGSGPIPTLSVTNVTCNGGNNGSASVTGVSGGVSPYTYLWSPGGSTNNSISSLTAGTYTVTVTDKNGCNSVNSVTVTQPNPLTFVVDTIPDTGSCTGQAWIYVSGGTGPYTFTWSATVSAIDSGNSQYVDSLCAGAYLLCITDANGCSNCDSVHVRHAPHKVTGLSEIASSGEGLTIYPNPSNGQFRISISGLAQNQSATVDVSDVLGEVVYKTSLESTGGSFTRDVNMQNAPAGLYFIRITTPNKAYTSKMVIGK